MNLVKLLLSHLKDYLLFFFASPNMFYKKRPMKLKKKPREAHNCLRQFFYASEKVTWFVKTAYFQIDNRNSTVVNRDQPRSF